MKKILDEFLVKQIYTRNLIMTPERKDKYQYKG